MVLRGIFAAAGTSSVSFLAAGAHDDFADGWRQLTPATRDAWERVAALLAITPPELLVPRDSPLLTTPPEALPAEWHCSHCDTTFAVSRADGDGLPVSRLDLEAIALAHAGQCTGKGGQS